MNSLCIRTLLGLVVFTTAAHFIQASQCPRTNPKPRSQCARKCSVKTGCSHKRKTCLCDGDCGYSCVNKRRKCSKPRRRIRGGTITYSSIRFNGTQITRCNPGYKLSGSRVRTCRGNGFWDGKTSRCKKPVKLCRDPGTPGLVLRYEAPSKKGFKPGSTLTHYCPPKFVSQGSSVIRCKSDGKWSAPVPTCLEPKCTAPVLPAYTFVVRPQNWKKLRDYGSRLTLGCKPGYTSVERGALVCVTPGWDVEPSSFKCFPKSCGDPGRPRNGDRKGLFTFNQKVYFKCHKCYMLKGPDYRQCQANQQWSDTQPKCERVFCPPPRSTRNGYIVRGKLFCGGTVEYRCRRGYLQQGALSRTCQDDGTWSGRLPICIPRGSAVKTTTVPAIRTSTSTTRRPTTASTTRSLPTNPIVYSPCGQPKLPPEGRISRNIKNKTLIIGCKRHYSLVSREVITCWKGTWAQVKRYGLLKCIPRGCHPPPTPKHGFKNGLSYLFNDVVSFSCDKCYSLVGPSERKCLTNRTWTGTEPKCVLKYCKPPTDTVSATVQYSLLSCGAIATYQCKKLHYKVIGTGEKTCDSNELWAGDDPKCIDPNENIALNKPTKQSSNARWWPGPSRLAVDGNRRAYYTRRGDNSCTHTDQQYGAWWRVDLLKEEPVARVIVVNRGNCCPYRLDDFEVVVGNDPNGKKSKRCGGKAKTKAGEIINIQCPYVLRGQYVIVRLPKSKNSVLTLCEVEVYRN